MDVLLDEYEEMLQRTAREFFERECPPALVRRMETDALGHSVEMWRQIAALGWLGFALPQAYGGEGAPLEQLGLLLEEMGRALAPFRSWGRREKQWTWRWITPNGGWRLGGQSGRFSPFSTCVPIWSPGSMARLC